MSSEISAIELMAILSSSLLIGASLFLSVRKLINDLKSSAVRWEYLKIRLNHSDG